MYPQFEEEIKLEHLQGYLYAQQIIENTALANAGSMRKYSINLIDDEIENEDLIDLAIRLILSKINHSLDVPSNNYKFFKENAHFKFLNDWEKELKKDLNNWFADKYLSGDAILDFYTKHSLKQKKWTKKQREEYMEKGQIDKQASKKRLKEWQPNSSNFINLVKGVLGGNELKILKITVPRDVKNKSGYPFHEMSFSWGWDFDVFILSNKNKKLMLHLGNVLT